ALTTLILLVAALALRAPWPRWREAGRLTVAGLLVHALYLGGVYVAIARGVEAGTSALIVSLQPLLVGALAAPLLGERVRARQWLGLGLGVLGCALVVWQKVGPGGAGLAGVLLCLAALGGITAGTLWQKRFCQGMDFRSGNLVQFAGATLATGVLALVLEDEPIIWSGTFVFALLWLILVLSLGAITLLYLLIRRGAASRVSSLFFLVPPTTALMAWAMFDERLGPVEIAGMAVAVAGVALVNVRSS
ncbi:MAG TPA: DMT family transporter, partial [Geminicoccaceae bacterium]|nr:DMT family transporter [Geminicoccaceae bacterium]